MTSLDHFNSRGIATLPTWLADASADAYTPRPTPSSVGEFVRKDWKEIAGVGIVVLAAGAILVATHGSKLGALTDLLRGGESTAVSERAGITGVSQDVLERLKRGEAFRF